jgi:hypothetical protein
MTSPDQQRVFEALWPSSAPQWHKVCAVLDSARDPKIFGAVETCRLDKCCLYAGNIPWLLQKAAPYLVVLEPEDRFTRFLIEEGWGNSWGIFLRTDAGMLQVRRHLRTLLRVKDESGRKLLFRWYDPRVLRRYLPTCLPAELEAVFGPVETFLLESEDPGTMLQFRVAANELKVSSRIIQSAA